MTNESDATPPRKTLSVKRPRPLEKPAAPAPRETPPPREATAPREVPREAPRHEARAGKLFALDDHMRRMQADMDKLGMKKE